MIFVLLIAGIFLLDYMLKEHTDSSRLQGTKQEILGGRLILRNCHNEGAAFGMFKMEKKHCLEASAFVLGGAIWEFVRQLVHSGSRMGKLGLSMVLGGGLSNYFDRRNKGYVTDYVSFGVKNKKLRNMVFNISDFFILGGTVLWVISAILPRKKER